MKFYSRTVYMPLYICSISIIFRVNILNDFCRSHTTVKRELVEYTYRKSTGTRTWISFSFTFTVTWWTGTRLRKWKKLSNYWVGVIEKLVIMVTNLVLTLILIYWVCVVFSGEFWRHYLSYSIVYMDLIYGLNLLLIRLIMKHNDFKR